MQTEQCLALGSAEIVGGREAEPGLSGSQLGHPHRRERARIRWWLTRHRVGWPRLTWGATPGCGWGAGVLDFFDGQFQDAFVDGVNDELGARRIAPNAVDNDRVHLAD